MNRELLAQSAAAYGTPSYVFNLDELTRRLLKIKSALSQDITLCYAMKANPFLITAMQGLADRFEVCSPGEFRICERNQIPMEQIVLSGVNKEYGEISRILNTHGGKCIFTVESLEHIRMLNACSHEQKETLTVLLRLTSGNQFGMDEDTICQLIQNRTQYPYLKFQGLQYYSGTQKKKLANIERELLYLDALCSRISTDFGFEIQELEYGPGFFVPYFQNEEAVDEDVLLKDFSAILHRLNFSGHISLEMGRYIAACCGYYLTSVVDLKVNNAQNYCLIDGGIHHLNYYGQAMAMKRPHFQQLSEAANGVLENWNICGSLCTVGDVLVKQLPLSSIRLGDVLVFERVGAYSVTEGIYLFLSRDLPQILFYCEQEGYQLVRGSKPTDTINSIQ